MTISALVITLVDDAVLRSRALESLGRDARLSLGKLTGHKLPVVAETASMDAGCSLFRQLREEPFVEHVDVVSVHFEDELAAGE